MRFKLLAPLDGAGGDDGSGDGSSDGDIYGTGIAIPGSEGEGAGNPDPNAGGDNQGAPADGSQPNEGNNNNPAAGQEGQGQPPAAGKPAAGAPPAGAKPPVAPAKPAESEEERLTRIATTAAARVAAQNAPKGQPAQPQEEQLTQEQIDQLINPVRVTADTLKAFGIENASPEMIKGVQTFSNAIVKNAYSLAGLRMEQMLRTTLAPYEPLVAYIQERQAKETVDSFYGGNPELKKYEKLVQMAATKVSHQKEDGSSKSLAEVYSEVANLTKTMLTEMGITLTPGNANPGAAPKNNGVPTMAALQGAGRSMGGQPSGEPNNPDADIYSTN